MRSHPYLMNWNTQRIRNKINDTHEKAARAACVAQIPGLSLKEQIPVAKAKTAVKALLTDKSEHVRMIAFFALLKVEGVEKLQKDGLA